MRYTNKLFGLAILIGLVVLASCFASAITLPPVVSIGASPNPTTLSSAVTAVAVDLSSSGISSVKIYEDNVLVKECSTSTCVYSAFHSIPGVRNYYAVASDNGGRTTRSNVVGVNFQNSAPVLNAIGNKNVLEGTNLQFVINGYDYNNDALTYSAIGIPLGIGATFNAGTRMFSWTPNSTQSGIYFVTFSVSDGLLSDSETITINVSDVTIPVIPSNDSEAPRWANLTENPVNATYAPGQNYTFGISWTDNVSVANVWVSFDGINHTIAGNGSYNFTISDLAAGNHSYSWYANDLSGNVNTTGIRNYAVNKAVPALLINILPSSSVNNGTTTNVSGLGCPAQLNCTLYRDGTNVSNPDVAVLGVGAYTYLYKSTGNENYSAGSITGVLNVVASGSSDNGGSTSSSGSTHTISDADLAKGVYVTLDINDRIKFNFCGSPYYIKLTDSDDVAGKAYFRLTPNNYGFMLKEGYSENLDLNSDGTKDVLFRLDTAGSNSAKIYIKRISNVCSNAEAQNLSVQEVQKLQPKTGNQEDIFTWAIVFLIMGILLAFLAILIYFLRGKRRKK